MTEVKHQSEQNDEPLSWLAYRYISGEMSAAEVDVFESRLNPDSPTFDLAACEAIAQSVQLADAVADAFEPVIQPTLPSVETKPRQRDVIARRVSLFAASITVLAVGWALTLSTSPKPVEVVHRPAPQPAEDSSVVPGELVQLWADSGDELLSAVEEVQLLPAADMPEHLSPDVPDWLLAAVQSHDPTSSNPEVMEN